jgi:hypothetical protein
VIDVGTAVEDDFLDAGLDGALGNQLADRSGGSRIGTGLERTLEVLLQRRRGGKRVAVGIVDDLDLDVLGGAMHRKARTTVRNLLELTANARSAALDGILGSHVLGPCLHKPGLALRGR